MFKPRKRLVAALGAVTVVGTAGLTALAPPALAATPVPVSMHCELPLGLPAADVDINFAIDPPADPVAPGGTAKLHVDLGKTITLSMGDIPGVDFDVAVDFAPSGGSTSPTQVTGSGKLDVPNGQPIVIPPFDGDLKVPADTTGNMDLVPTGMTLTALGSVKVPCTVKGTAPSVATVKVDTGATPPPGGGETTPPPGGGDTTPPPGGGDESTPPPGGGDQSSPPVDSTPNGKEVDVQYTCKTTLDPPILPVPDTTSTLGVKIVVPSAAKSGDTVDISAAFRNNVLGTAPSMVPSNTNVKFTPKLTIDVKEGANKGTATVALPETNQVLSAGDPMKASGPLTGKFKVWGGGDFSFTPGKLVTTTVSSVGNLHTTSTTNCTPTKTSVSATMKATGDQGTPPPPTDDGGNGGNGGGNNGNGGNGGGNNGNGGNGGDNANGGNGGNLAHTGASGGGVSALAMLAGSLVLAAIAVLLFLPHRRRFGHRS